MSGPQQTDGGAGGAPGESPAPLSNVADVWREHAGLAEARGDERDLAGAIIETVVEDAGEGDGVPDRLEEIVARGRVEEAWDAVEELYLALDRAVESAELASSEARRCRRRLTRIQSRLHRAGLRARLSARRELLRDITHDLRVPLNSIVFLTDSLFDERHGQLTEAQRRKLGGVYSASTTLLNFINDLLDLARSSEEDFEFTRVPFSIQGVLEDVRHLVRPVADYHGAVLDVDLRTGDSWDGDPRLVRRVLLNLVTNGLEAVGEGGRVTVTLDGGDRDPGWRRIVVADDGPGIDVERAEALLRPAGSPGWRELEGTEGLGLLIIGRLARAAGGSVEVERAEEGGTRFTVELPFGEGGGGEDA